jgi:AcrR family transcriptional regulator
MRETILEAADHLFRRYGYRKTTVEDISDQAKTSRVAVYNHFRSKEEIAISWVARMNARVVESLGELAVAPGTAVERVRKLLMGRILLRFDASQELSESIDDLLAALRAPLAKERQRCQELEAQMLASVVSEGRARNEFGLRKPDETARSLIIATNSLLPYNLTAEQLGRRDEIEAAAGSLVDLLLNGCRTRYSPRG